VDDEPRADRAFEAPARKALPALRPYLPD
jgi:hypothetical protein